MSGQRVKLNLRIFAIMVVVGVAVIGGAPVARAAVVPWDLTGLTLQAGLIVRGRVVEQTSAWNKPRTTIDTETTLDVVDAIKGRIRREKLVIRTPGGVVRDVGLWVEPAPRFVTGEEVLVFLTPLQAGDYGVVGSVEGKYVLRDGWAMNDALGTAEPLISLIGQVLDIMDAHDVASPLPADWESRLPPAAASPPDPHEPQSFTYNGVHWPDPAPMGEDYVVNTNTSGVSSTQAVAAIQAAADTWTNVSGADFTFTYSDEPSSATDKGRNGKNEIVWKTQTGTSTLATTWVWYWTTGLEIFEADMVINDYYTWDTSGSPAGNEVDLQSVALHEFGHYLQLEHDGDPNAVMYPSIPGGVVKRDLHQNEIDGIRTIYPGPANPCQCDFDGDGVVMLDDINEIVSRWHLTAENPNPDGDPETANYNVTYDLNDDGCIDVRDVSLAVTEFNKDCG
ncbi:MAG: hypothetical protein MAG451_00098 [Anaerolineales bacterium]|nr:hypothetical protein [Anaerolineales bacterium]